MFKPAQVHFCTQLNGFTYFYLKQIILFTINHLLLNICLHGINVFKYCYLKLIIQLNISHFYAQMNHQTVLFKQFILAYVNKVKLFCLLFFFLLFSFMTYQPLKVI